MQLAPVLGIPEVKPAIESIRGAWFQKVSPRTRHSLLQGRMFLALATCLGERGFVGPEWRFYFAPSDERPSSLVPDVAFVSKERLPSPGDARERPLLAPDIAVEVLSPGDRVNVLETKIELYLTHGAVLVIVVDPDKKTVRFRERDRDASFARGERACGTAFPELAIDVTELFAGLD